MSTASPSETLNVAARLTAAARADPERVAVAAPLDRDAEGRRRYARRTFAELDALSDRYARGLVALGVAPGTRLALLVPQGLEFVTLVFALLKSGATAILIDPGMGRRNLVGCLQAAEPEGFVAVPAAQAVRTLLRHKFPRARIHVTAGRRWFWGGVTLEGLATLGDDTQRELPTTAADDPAAIIFTTGSTGPPKGVHYTQRVFDTQVEQIQRRYGIEPGGVDLAGFPLFGLFNAAMGVTTVIPDMDPTRPADVDPALIVEAVRDWRVTQSFGSPALWQRVGLHCRDRSERLETVRQVFSAGAPVPADVLRMVRAAIAPDGQVHTPYGATEALPVASIEAAEVLGETAAATAQGRGVCVGRRFDSIEWRVIAIDDGPLATLDDTRPLPPNEIGELIVCGPQVTTRYATRTEWNARAKIADGPRTWHRMGDVGYLDEAERFWFCGRKAHRVETAEGTLFTVPCEAIFNAHPAIYRTALVGVGPAGSARPVIVAEPHRGALPATAESRRSLRDELAALGAAHELTAGIGEFLLHLALPVDIRHNAKIFREQLAVWAAKELKRGE